MGTNEYSLHLTMQQDKPSSRKVFRVGPHEPDEKMRVRTIMDREDFFSADTDIDPGDFFSVSGLSDTEERDDALLMVQADNPIMLVATMPFIGASDDYKSAVSVDGSGFYIEYDTNDYNPYNGNMALTGAGGLWASIKADGVSTATNRRIYSIDTAANKIVWLDTLSMTSSATFFLYNIGQYYGKTHVISPPRGFSSIALYNVGQTSVSVKLTLVGGTNEDG